MSLIVLILYRYNMHTITTRWHEQPSNSIGKSWIASVYSDSRSFYENIENMKSLQKNLSLTVSVQEKNSQGCSKRVYFLIHVHTGEDSPLKNM